MFKQLETSRAMITQPRAPSCSVVHWQIHLAGTCLDTHVGSAWLLSAKKAPQDVLQTFSQCFLRTQDPQSGLRSIKPPMETLGESPTIRTRPRTRPKTLSLKAVCPSQHDPLQDRDNSCAHSSTTRPSLNRFKNQIFLL